MVNHRPMMAIGMGCLISAIWQADAIYSLIGTVWICSGAIVKAINNLSKKDKDHG